MNKKSPEIRFKGFTDDWEQYGFLDSFECPVSTNSLSRAQLKYDEGIIRSVHYGDILINYNSVLDVQKNIIPFVTDGTFDKYKHNLLKNGDIIFADAAEDESVGKVVEVYNIGNKNIVAGLHTIVARSRILRGHYFLGYYINTNSYRKQILRLMQGTKISSISKKTLTETKVIIPITIKEQGKIGQLFKTLDDTIALHQDAIQRQQDLKKALLQKLFPVNGERIPTVRFETFKEEWEQRKLIDVADILGGGTPSTTILDYWDGEIDWYSPVEIGEQVYVNGSQKKLTELGLKKSSAKVLPVGTVLFTSRAGIGKTAILAKEGATNQGFQSIVPHKNALDSYFIYSRTNELKRYGEIQGAGSTFVEVSGKQMAKMPILIPILEEQTKIGTFFKHLDNTIALHQDAIRKLQLLKQSLLQKMFVN